MRTNEDNKVVSIARITKDIKKKKQKKLRKLRNKEKKQGVGSVWFVKPSRPALFFTNIHPNDNNDGDSACIEKGLHNIVDMLV